MFYKKIIAFICSFAMLFSLLAVPVSADYVDTRGGFWNWIYDQTSSSDNKLLNAIGGVVGFVAGGVCTKSDDTYHRADVVSVVGEGGRHVATCKYCGEIFKVYDSDLDAAYKKYVQTLPVSQIDSQNRGYVALTWTLRASDSRCTMDENPPADHPYLSGFMSSSGTSYHFFTSSTFTCAKASTYSLIVDSPVGTPHPSDSSSSGTNYTPLVFASGADYTVTSSYTARISPSSLVFKSGLGTFNVPAGTFYIYFPVTLPHLYSGNAFSVSFPHVYLRFDASAVDSVMNVVTVDTRPTSITGDYGIIGDNGEVTVVNGNILDETGKTIYNPVTNTTTNFESWQYDYSTRTYTVTLSTGDTQTITYGDEYVTINEGDTVYNVYYIVQGGGGTPVDPNTCQHTYASTTDREPTCTVPGSKTLTCSKCGNVTTESIPAKGHTWTVLQTVQTSYDENGQLVQQGYTIYQCSVCGEQYKDVNGTGPPGGQEEEKKSIWEKLGDLIGSVAGGFITIIETALSKVLDYLIALVEGINAKLESVVNSIFGLFDRIPQLFGGFTGFLTAVFPFLPQEFFDILIFTLLVICAAAIIRFLWKR